MDELNEHLKKLPTEIKEMIFKWYMMDATETEYKIYGRFLKGYHRREVNARIAAKENREVSGDELLKIRAAFSLSLLDSLFEARSFYSF
jgi:hypothetical protein